MSIIDISIIIPFYNNVEWLYEAVNSIREPKELIMEIIIVNDGSKENIDINQVKEHKSIIKVINQLNQGPGKARNTGIEIAKGNYIAFLDSDDLFLENKLSKQIKYMQAYKKDWCHSSYYKFYENKSKVLVDNSDFYGKIFPLCLAYNPIATPTVVVRRDILTKPLKRFSEEMRFGQDGFMWSQIGAYYSVGVINEPLTLVRMRGTNATLKAKNHLYVKAKMYNYIKNKDIYYPNKRIPIFLKMVFALSALNYKIVEFFSKKRISNRFIEIISRILYSSQYIALKVYVLKKN